MEILKIEKLYFAYEKNNDILKDVSFTLNKGEYVSLIGANGSGKSTIAKLILGLLESKRGKIAIDKMELNIENLATIRNYIGIVFQNPDNQFIGSTVEDDIAFGLENHQVASEEMPAIIEHFSKEVRMHDFLQFEPSRLSGGQKQRVAIAGVLAMNPELIIFDEATSMLDSQGKTEILNIIFELHKKQKKTILSITHDMEEITYSDRVLILNQGRIIFAGTPKELLKKPDVLRQAKMKSPFVADFAQKYNEKGKKIDIPLSLNELVESIWQSISNK